MTSHSEEGINDFVTSLNKLYIRKPTGCRVIHDLIDIKGLKQKSYQKDFINICLFQIMFKLAKVVSTGRAVISTSSNLKSVKIAPGHYRSNKILLSPLYSLSLSLPHLSLVYDQHVRAPEPAFQHRLLTMAVNAVTCKKIVNVCQNF